MSMSKNIVFQGWLTKSPPTNRLFKTRWQRRWFILRQSTELPGQYFLDYYADRNCRRLKGTINLDLCEQVDAGLDLERTSPFDPRHRGSVFTIQTQERSYHFEADCDGEMEKWVTTICRVCGLKAIDDTPFETYQNNLSAMSAMNEQYECADTTGPYIPISECITGVRAQDTQAFTFDPKSIVMSSRTALERVSDNRNHQMYMSQPHIRLNNTDLSENESNLSDEECKSLSARQPNIRCYDKAKVFKKKKPKVSSPGPPVPPRPPKTLPREYQGPKIQEPVDPLEGTSQTPWPPRRSPYSSRSPSHSQFTPLMTTDDEDDYGPSQAMKPYYNITLPARPPTVDRALKPRHNVGQITQTFGQALQFNEEERKAATLQYLDLDLPQPSTSTAQNLDAAQPPRIIGLGKSDSPDYKEVDFIKTEAFHLTCRDTEALRNYQI